jgi:hypothetical protein
VLEAARVERGAHLVAGADGHRALHHDDRTRLDRALELVDHGPHAREIGVARGERRRVDADVDEVGVLDRLADVEREREPLGVPRDQLLEAGLVDRDLAAAQPLDLLRHHIAHDDLVAELGEACARDEADVAGAEDPDPCHRLDPSFRRPASGPWRSRASSRSRAS